MSAKELKQAPEVLSQQWIFTVSAPNAEPNEKVFVTGSTPELGEWDFARIVPMNNVQGTDLWSKTVTIPNTCNVYYRYVLCMVVDDDEEVAVRRWETNIQPRVIVENMLHPATDAFGEFEGQQMVSRGWLTAHTLVQFKFANNPLQLKSRLAGRTMNIKVTPVKLSFGTEPHVEDSVEVDVPPGVYVEVSTLDNDPSICSLQPQEQFGREYKANDVLLVNVFAPNPKNLAYLVDFYSYSTRASVEDPPCHVGYTYVLPNMFKPSEGNLALPVTCNVKHRPLGTINMEYVVIYPMAESLSNLQVSFSKHWNPTWTGLEVGHRGLGASFKNKEGNAIRENTIASLKKAAASGADMLEFDVQLSKDLIPVIYHDYYVCISMKQKKEVNFSDMLELPVKDLTLEHLHKLKVYHLVEGRNQETLFNDDDLEEHQPFPTLQEALKSIEAHVGFNVELKWNMEMNDGTFELNNPFDMNLYVDKVLEVVLKHGGERRIVFSCFNPDICTMVRNKQNKYPVMFLTVGVSQKYQPYRDPRCLSIPAAVQSAISSDILGIVVHTEDLLRDPTQVKLATNAGLVIFCWGDDNNDKNTIAKLKQMGLHAVIYDKLDQYSTKEVKESIFLMEARESQRDMMRQTALDAPPPPASPCASAARLSADSAATPPGSEHKPFLDLAVRHRIQELSTATSLESLAMSVDLRDDPTDISLKRNRDIISNIEKESQSNGNNYMSGEPRRKREPPARPNHILLYTIINPAYPITVDVIHTISTPHGQVQRIVVFKKNGVQAMVEFECVESATRAKEALHGCDIYSGCCTLKIEFAKPERLNVFKNDQDSWDYTLLEDVQPVQRSAPLLQSPQYTGGRPQPYNMDYGSGGPPPPGMMKERHGPPPPHHPRDGRGYGPEGYGGEGFVPPPPMHHPMPPQNQGGPPQQGAVMMVYGLDPQSANADRLFNLCCLYGNVVRIKFLKTKEGTAMVQMGDGVSVERCVQNLNNVTVGDYTLTLAFSKQAYLSEVMNPYPLPDKSPSFKDYVGNKNNRFLTPASIHKNRIQPPSKVLHFFNTPPDVSDEQLLQVFEDYGVQPPHTISKFPLKSERSSSGLMEFQNISQSVMAIMACNHATIQHPGAKFPFVMKLCFSSSRQIGQGKGPQPGSKQESRQGQNNEMDDQEYY